MDVIHRDLIRFNVVAAVPQELQNLYRLMEVEFDPLHLCSRMQGNIEWIQEHPELGWYLLVDWLCFFFFSGVKLSCM